MSPSEIVKLIVVLVFTLMCLIPDIDAAVVSDSSCASCRDGEDTDHCSRCKRFCTPLMNGCYYKRDGSDRMTDSQRYHGSMLDRISEGVKASTQQHLLSKRNFRSTRTRSECAVENLISSLPNNWQQDILEVVRWAIMAQKGGSLPSETAQLAEYLFNYIELEQSNL